MCAKQKKPPKTVLRITAREMPHHLEYIQRAMGEYDIEKRKQILLEGFFAFGIKFIFTLNYLEANDQSSNGFFSTMNLQAKEVFFSLFNGKKLTDRVDEDERKAFIAADLLQQDKQFVRLAAEALLALPEGHPLRDLEKIKQSLLEALEAKVQTKEYDDQLLLIKVLLHIPFEKDEYFSLIEKGNALIPHLSDPALSHDYHIAVIHVYLQFLLDEEERPEEERQYYKDKAFELIEQMKEKFPDRFNESAGINFYAVVMTVCNKEEEAAQSFAKVVDNSHPAEESHRTAAIIETRFRMDLEQYDRVIQILPPIIPYLEEAYLLAVEDTALIDLGEHYYQAVCYLAFAHAHTGHWAQAIEFLERSKSRRLLFQGAIRSDKNAEQLLALEKNLHAINRQVELEEKTYTKKQHEDWYTQKVSLKSKLLEEYRKQRKQHSVVLPNPTLSTIAALLDEEEALVTIGLTKKGTLMAVICKDDREEPSYRFIDRSMNFRVWGSFFAGENEDGWLYALGAPEKGIDHKQALPPLLDGVEALIGKHLQQALGTKPIKRVTVVPHQWLHLIPFWALPSLDGYEVTIAGSAAHFIAARQGMAKANKNVLVVSNPTLNLPGSSLEAAKVLENLSPAGFHIRHLAQEQATEMNIVKNLDKVSIFHFCGHGRSDISQPEQSALMVSADLTDPRMGKQDPFQLPLSQIHEWKDTAEGIREGRAPGIGYLVEKRAPNGEIQERVLEMGASTSLRGEYRNGQLTGIMELWTAGDIMVQGSLNECALAFLSACEVGAGSMSTGIDECAGLPAALQLAGVRTVIGSLWQVDDTLTALYVHLFYQELAGAKGVVSIPAMVKQTNNKVRRLMTEEAIDLLLALRHTATEAPVRKEIDNYIWYVKESGNPYPFSHPIDWAAFYVTGATHLDLGS